MLLLSLLFPSLFLCWLIAPCVRGSLWTTEQVFLSSATGSVDNSVNGSVVYEHVRISSLSSHSLRVTEPDPSLCDPTVKQHAGFLDVTASKHLFFWFFESRKTPEKAPLTLWLSGGPGRSSATGMLNALGLCNIANEGKNATFNLTAGRPTPT